MIAGIRFKVCGLTSLVDAEFADHCGADYLGFNLYPKSPRYISLAQFLAMAPRLPERKRVAVMVSPSPDELREANAAGFDYFQIHFPHETAVADLIAWNGITGEKRLWLAPKLPPSADVAPEALALARVIMLDTFHAEGFGGSGRTGDWAKFARHQFAHPKNIWLLAGGLNPANIGDAVRQSGARFVDVNSGVESAPGVKDRAKLKAFVAALQRVGGGLRQTQG